MPLPHEPWAEVYDFFYEETFGAMYGSFTRETLSHITRNADGRKKIIDFGAGTGRVAIPLALEGHQVTAVEPSTSMMQVLLRKAGDAEVPINHFTQKIQGFIPEGDQDLALCLFTVIAYTTEEHELELACSVMARSLKPGGLLILDAPSEGAFGSMSKKTGRMERNMVVEPLGNGLYRYTEDSYDLRNGARIRYRDQFQIRCWPKERLLSTLGTHGMTLENYAPMPGSQHLFLRKNLHANATASKSSP